MKTNPKEILTDEENPENQSQEKLLKFYGRYKIRVSVFKMCSWKNVWIIYLIKFSTQ